MRFFIPSYSMFFSVKPNKAKFIKKGFEIEEKDGCGYVEIKTLEDLLRFYEIVFSLRNGKIDLRHSFEFAGDKPDCKWELDIRQEATVIDSFE